MNGPLVSGIHETMLKNVICKTGKSSREPHYVNGDTSALPPQHNSRYSYFCNPADKSHTTLGRFQGIQYANMKVCVMMSISQPTAKPWTDLQREADEIGKGGSVVPTDYQNDAHHHDSYPRGESADSGICHLDNK